MKKCSLQWMTIKIAHHSGCHRTDTWLDTAMCVTGWLVVYEEWGGVLGTKNSKPTAILNTIGRKEGSMSLASTPMRSSRVDSCWMIMVVDRLRIYISALTGSWPLVRNFRCLWTSSCGNSTQCPRVDNEHYWTTLFASLQQPRSPHLSRFIVHRSQTRSETEPKSFKSQSTNRLPAQCRFTATTVAGPKNPMARHKCLGWCSTIVKSPTSTTMSILAELLLRLPAGVRSNVPCPSRVFLLPP